MIDQEQVARTLVNLIDVVHQERWVLFTNKDMAKQVEDYYVNYFSEHDCKEAIDEIRETIKNSQNIFNKLTSNEELNSIEMRDFMQPFRNIKSKYLNKK